MKKMFSLLTIAFIFLISFNSFAHSGRTDSLGGHNVNTAGKGYEVGTYHYHTGQYAGWIVQNKGDIPDPNKDTFDKNLINDGSTPVIKPISTDETTKVEESTLFNDLSNNHWAKDSIKEMVNEGIINGYPDGSFKPENNMTREQFAKLIYKIFSDGNEYSGESTFLDVTNDKWSYNYIESSKEYLTGYFFPNGNAYFRPEEYATREDVAVALVKALNFNIDNIDVNNILNDKFSDVNEISSNLKVYIAVAVENNLINGFPDGTLRPNEPLTRAQASTLLFRVFKDSYSNNK